MTRTEDRRSTMQPPRRPSSVFFSQKHAELQLPAKLDMMYVYYWAVLSVVRCVLLSNPRALRKYTAEFASIL